MPWSRGSHETTPPEAFHSSRSGRCPLVQLTEFTEIKLDHGIKNAGGGATLIQ